MQLALHRSYQSIILVFNLPHILSIKKAIIVAVCSEDERCDERPTGAEADGFKAKTGI